MRTTFRAIVLFSLLPLAACGGGMSSRSAGPMPQGGTFTGVWFSPQYGEMNMVQTGNAVVGEYHKDERAGRIQGTANGNLMRFEWTEERELVGGLPQTTRGRGYFHYLIDDSGKHNLLGEWGIDDSDSGGGDWNAYKMMNRQPHLANEGQGDTSGGDNDDWNDTGENEGGGSWDDGGGDSGGGDSGGGGDIGGGGDDDDPGNSLDDLDL